ATLPGGQQVSGNVLIGQGPGGNGVSVQASFAGLPATGGPFLYHIHEKALSADGNCSSAGAHLSPYTSQYPCLDIDHPENCEAGDLSGKHGNINGTSFSGNYIDEYISNNAAPGCSQCMKGRSLVIHFDNQTAIACANFTLSG
ncbi:Cu,Zn superoxide dismutase-like protein, partial [Sphaerulina musiva SO2202]